MSDLERNLNRVLQEHQQESGLHMIGGQRRLVDRLVQFIEKRDRPEEQWQKPKKNQQN